MPHNRSVRRVTVSLLVALLACPGGTRAASPTPEPPAIPLPPALEKIAPKDAAAVAEKIIAAARASRRPHERLVDLCDRVGPRLAGSPGYAKAVEWAMAEFTAAGLSDVRRQDVTVRGWERGSASLELVEPAPLRSIPVAALGPSIGTPSGGITAPVMVVKDFAELEARGEEARGKIVLFNFAMTREPGRGYGTAASYRWRGAVAAASHGAVASIIRSLTMNRARSPHTGSMGYEDGAPKIPAAAIPIEDAEMLQRLVDRGLKPVLRLALGARETSDVTDANVIAELKGRERPGEIVVIGAHLDSWDLASGAHDDGAGVILAIEAARLLKELKLVPRRTIRVVLFANEERGLSGGNRYFEAEKDRLEQHVAALEADAGGFKPAGFHIEVAPAAAEQLEALLALFRGLGEFTLRRGWSGADIGPLAKAGVPALGLSTDTTHYFDFHHSELDTPDKVDPAELNESVAAFALMGWLLGEMPEPLPRAAPGVPEDAGR